MWLRLAEGIVKHSTEKEVASGATTGCFFREVRGIAMHVQNHVRSTVEGFGAGTSHRIVEQSGDILVGFVGGLVLMGSDCADVRKNGIINSAAIVEGDTNDFLNVLYCGRVDGIEEFWGRR